MMARRNVNRDVLWRALAGLAIAAASLYHPEAAFAGQIATALLDIASRPARQIGRSPGTRIWLGDPNRDHLED